MDNEKMMVNFAPGCEKAELVIREGAATPELAKKAPIKANINGTLGAPLEYLKKRLQTNQFTQQRSYIEVDREHVTIKLIINEDDEYNRGTICGSLQIDARFEKFGINTSKAWQPAELGMFLKMNRSYFTDKKTNMDLVTSLMNFTATVNHKIERSVNEKGDRTDNFAQVVNSNLPGSFKMKIPIFKGMPSEEIEVETFARVDGRDVSFILLSPGAEDTFEDIRDKSIDAQLDAIKEIAPDIAIIEI